MRYLYKLKNVLFVVLLTFLITCCGDDHSISEPSYHTLNVSLKSSEMYQYESVSGDEEGMSILVQAKNYDISEIKRDRETNYNGTYKYKAKLNFEGNDYVELKIETGSDGASKNTKIQVIKINFIVSK